jgi:hypothetical protein
VQGPGLVEFSALPPSSDGLVESSALPPSSDGLVLSSALPPSNEGLRGGTEGNWTEHEFLEGQTEAHPHKCSGHCERAWDAIGMHAQAASVAANMDVSCALSMFVVLESIVTISLQMYDRLCGFCFDSWCGSRLKVSIDCIDCIMYWLLLCWPA